MDDSRRRRSKEHDSRTKDLEQGRERYASRAWAEAYDFLVRADEAAPLGGADLELATWAAALSGRDHEMLGFLERLYRIHLDAGEQISAARCAFWLGFRLMSLGEPGRGGGWLGRAQELVEQQDAECAMRGYLLLTLHHQALASGSFEAANDAAGKAVEIGERCGDEDLAAFARVLQGGALMRLGRIAEGTALLDEVLIVAASDALSPLMTGLVYCSAIANCQRVQVVDRAREWTSSFADWCRKQPQLDAFAGICRVHRAEVMQLGGAWHDAIEEAQRASQALSPRRDPQALADAFYQQAEVHRLRGELDQAEEAYRNASQLGRDPQPGLALLRLAQGDEEAASNAIRRVVRSTKDPLERMRLLPALVEIMLALGELDEARDACEKLETAAAEYETEVSTAVAAHARGALHLAEGHGESAEASLRHAFAIWQQLAVPYLAARARRLLGRACRLLGDEDSARLELEAAREVFDSLGATLDVTLVDALLQSEPSQPAHAPHERLSPRELQVLRLVARGRTNRAIAADLKLSEKTVEHHVSHILTKLDVPSRAAATAYGYEHGLI